MDLAEDYKANYKKWVKLANWRVDSFWAEDVVQETYERALRWYKPETVLSFDAWMMSTFKSVCAKYLAISMGRYTDIDEEEIEDAANTASAEIAEEFIHRTKGMREDHQHILYCSLILGMRDLEIIKATGVSGANIRKIRSRFIKETNSGI